MSKSIELRAGLLSYSCESQPQIRVVIQHYFLVLCMRCPYPLAKLILEVLAARLFWPSMLVGLIAGLG